MSEVCTAHLVSDFSRCICDACIPDESRYSRRSLPDCGCTWNGVSAPAPGATVYPLPDPLESMLRAVATTLENCDLIASDLTDLVNAAVNYGRFLK